MRWELMTPPDFKKLAKEEQLCIVPVGSLERHGDHLPFGCDSFIAHKVACLAAEKEKCVVFPPYWFGQLHEASCFTGSIVLSAELLLKLLEEVVDEIGRNGFKKILLLNGHGGNNGMLDFFSWATVDRNTPYSLYISPMIGAEWGKRTKKLSSELLETQPIGHACEYETSMMMAIVPEYVKMENQTMEEPITALGRMKHLPGVYNGLSWFADYPHQVIGCPGAGSAEKGNAFLKSLSEDLAELIRAIKEDTAVESLKAEFMKKRSSVGSGSVVE